MLERNELASHEETWRKRKCILLSNIRQYVMATYSIIPAL